MPYEILDKSKLDPERKFIDTPMEPGNKYYCIECAKCKNKIPILKYTGTGIPSIISYEEGNGLTTACPKCRHEQAYKVEDVHIVMT